MQQDIVAADDGGMQKFMLKSSTDSTTIYTVKLDNGNGFPFCGCYDWAKHHYPCKHLLAVIASGNFPNYTWDSLPREYRNSPFINLHDTQAATNMVQLPPTTSTESHASAQVQEDNPVEEQSTNENEVRS